MPNSEPWLPVEITGIKSSYVKLVTILSVIRAEGVMLAKGYFPSEIVWSSVR